MPRTRLPLPEQLPYQDFVTSLTEELLAEEGSHPPEAGRTDAPDIIEEPVPYSDRFYITVIWDAWANVPPQERGKIILDAYREARLQNPEADYLIDPVSMSIAMGLTRSEARRLGVVKDDAA